MLGDIQMMPCEAQSNLSTREINSPVGCLRLVADSDYVQRLDFIDAASTGAPHVAHPVLDEAEKQLNAYFNGRLRVFDLPLAFKGTAFQCLVWETLKEIPYGQTWSYKVLAEAVNRPKGFQAVGQANGRNPIAIIVPCHRVIAAGGGLGGYAGGLSRKRTLLNLEKGLERESL